MSDHPYSFLSFRCRYCGEEEVVERTEYGAPLNAVEFMDAMARKHGLCGAEVPEAW